MPFIYEKGKEMSKAILILDKMPNECMECELRFKDGDTDDWFRFRCHMTTDQVNKGERLENCPLKPLPKKYIKIAQIENGIVKNNEEIQFMRGWNDCIDEILGEKEW